MVRDSLPFDHTRHLRRTMLRYLLLACVALNCNGFQVSRISLRNSAPCYQRKHATSPTIMAESPVNMRREAIKIMVASSSATMLSALWAAFPAPVSAYTETKEDLVAQANYIVKVRSTLPIYSQSVGSSHRCSRRRFRKSMARCRLQKQSGHSTGILTFLSCGNMDQKLTYDT